MERKAYQQKFEEQLNALAAEIDRLLAKAEETARQQADDLPRKCQVARVKLEELKSSSSEAWGDLKPGFERAWGELRQSFQDAASRFQKKPEQPGGPAES